MKKILLLALVLLVSACSQPSPTLVALEASQTPTDSLNPFFSPHLPSANNRIVEK